LIENLILNVSFCSVEEVSKKEGGELGEQKEREKEGLKQQDYTYCQGGGGQ